MNKIPRIKLLRFYSLSIILGALVGLISTLLRLSISWLEQKLSYFNQTTAMWLLGALVIGLLITLVFYFVQRVSPEASGSGVQEIEGRLLHLRKIYWKRLIPVKFFGAVIAIGSKMILGREGPTIQIGGNLGKMLGDIFKLKSSRKDILIGAGAASGLAAAFNAPLAGVIFILEEMREHFKLSAISFKSVTIACVVATIVMRSYFGYGAEIKMEQFHMPTIECLPIFFIFGLVVGLVGLGFNISLMKFLDIISNVSFKGRLLFAFLIAFTIALMGYKYGYLVGGGYAIIQHSLSLEFSCSTLLIILVIRFIGTILCYSTGVPGGIFAPLLAIGTVLGILFGELISPLVSSLNIHEGMFAVAGMGGLFAACIRAPVTGIILIVEMTQNYQLILPLMITCLTATTVVQFANNLPLYYQLLQRLLSNAR